MRPQTVVIKRSCWAAAFAGGQLSTAEPTDPCGQVSMRAAAQRIDSWAHKTSKSPCSTRIWNEDVYVHNDIPWPRLKKSHTRPGYRATCCGAHSGEQARNRSNKLTDQHSQFRFR